MFAGKPDNLEVFRYFRSNCFDNVDEFYNYFYKVLDKDLKSFFDSNDKTIQSYQERSPFYTVEDIKFRLTRDIFLTRTQYEETMFLMMKEKQFIPEELYPKLLFNENNLKKLDGLGHLIGLHSHTHPTSIESLNYDEQKNEYEQCLSLISKILAKAKTEIKYMSHPCGSYNNDTLAVLKELGIELGFKQMMAIEPEKGMNKVNNSFLEVARQDHATIFKRMN